MTSSLDLPASVRDRACFQQYLGGMAVEQAYLDQAMRIVSEIGMPAIWAANEKNEPSVFNRSIYSLAAAMRISGLEAEVPDSHKAKASSGEQQTDHNGAPPYVISKGTAVIPVNGPLSKQPSSLEGIFGGSSTIGMRKALGLALADPKVERIMFHIDSPGGTVAGTGDLGDDIFLASSKKPVASFIEDMGTSAAYWIASQTSHIYASQYAHVGSIGVAWIVHDTSEAAAKDGIKVHAITSTPGKMYAVDGMPITKQQLAKMQSYVDAMYKGFVSVVARGRGVSYAEARAMSGDADIYDASTALSNGLIDAVSTFRDALAHFASGKIPMIRGHAMTGVVGREKPVLTPVIGQSDAVVELLNTDASTSILVPDAVVFTSERVSNTSLSMKENEESDTVPEKQDPVTASSASVPRTPTSEEFAALQVKADAGAEALKLIQAMQEKQRNAEASTLASERERLVAEYPAISKEAAAGCSDIPSLRSLETVARTVNGRRTSADPHTGGRVQVSAAQTAMAEFDEGRDAFLSAVALPGIIPSKVKA